MITLPRPQRVSHRSTFPPLLRAVWHRRWLGAVVAVGVAGVGGIVTALLMPRGPVTAPQTLLVMLGGLGVGGVAGLVLRSRWALLIAPFAHLAAFETGRLNAIGPTVDRVFFDSAYGILAFVLGRGVYALVALLPMALGATYGAALARRLTAAAADATSLSGRIGRAGRRGVAGGTTLALIALAVAIALPARTPPISGADGNPIPGSVAELTRVRLGDHDQWIMIRGYDATKPVLLYLSGGPGQSDLPFTRVLFDDLARDFVVVGWDQRGTGKSYPALDPPTLTLDRAVADTIELTNYLRERFGEQKIYLLGESWGSTLGVLAAQQRPDLFHAVIGSGQMVSQRETDRRLYADVLALADRTDDAELARTMRSYGEPPYNNVFASAFVMQQYERLSTPYTPPQAYIDRGTAAGLGPWGVFGSEYSPIEKVNVLRGLMDMFGVLYPQLQEIDFRRDVPGLDVPLYVLDGQAELRARRDLAREWLEQVDAPRKRIFSFPNAGHSVAFEQFEEFGRLMNEVIIPETYEQR
jgi:proline iminopeptidase